MKVKELLTEYGCPDLSTVQETTITNCTVSILQLRDKLCLLGKILHEDLDDQIYVATIRAGVGDLNSAVVAMQLSGESLHVAAYAKEGLLKQNISDKAIEKLRSAAQGKEIKIPSHFKRILPMLLSLVVIIAFVAIFKTLSQQSELDRLTGDLDTTTTTESPPAEDTPSPEELAFIAEVESTIEATKAYNEAVEIFNLRAAEYNEAVALTCIDNISGLPKILETLSTESESFDDNAAVVNSENSKELIAKDTATVMNMTTQVENAIAVLKQITAPSDEWVIERLSSVGGITGTQAVTETLNPDGLLGKEGGYSGCIYFTVSSINSSEIPGSSIVAKGTDVGGAVEIYSTLADAVARCEYLAGFDGTVLYSGSYAIVGTMVIRTSYKLTNEQQLELTNLITQAVTAVTTE